MGLRQEVKHKSPNNQEGYSVPTTVAVPQLLHVNVVEYLGGAPSTGPVFQFGG